VVEVVGVCESGGERQGSGESGVKGMARKPVAGWRFQKIENEEKMETFLASLFVVVYMIVLVADFLCKPNVRVAFREEKPSSCSSTLVYWNYRQTSRGCF
nr:hypothetical protein [Tanacetum cinerariifolium]